jgi:hypothetical protein
LLAEDLQQEGQQFARFGHRVLGNPFGGRAFLGFCRLDLTIAFIVICILLVCFFHLFAPDSVRRLITAVVSSEV